MLISLLVPPISLTLTRRLFPRLLRRRVSVIPSVSAAVFLKDPETRDDNEENERLERSIPDFRIDDYRRDRMGHGWDGGVRFLGTRNLGKRSHPWRMYREIGGAIRSAKDRYARGDERWRRVTRRGRGTRALVR